MQRDMFRAGFGGAGYVVGVCADDLELLAFSQPGAEPGGRNELAAAWSLVADALGQRLIRFFDGEQCRRPTVN